MLILERPWTTKPESPVPLKNGYPGINLYYPTQKGWYNAGSNSFARSGAGQKPIPTIYGAAAGVDATSGTAFVGDLAGKPIYGVITIVNIRNNTIVSTTAGNQLWAIDSNVFYSNFGSWTGYLTNETIAIGSATPSDTFRQGITSTIGLGIKVLAWLWNGSNYIPYVNGVYDGSHNRGTGSWLGFKTATTGTLTMQMCNSSGQPAVDILANIVVTRALAHGLLQQLQTNVPFLWSLLAPRRIYVPTSTAAASAPSITALSAISITATSAQPRISYS